MPDLPNVGWERDLESFREFFENPAFRSDGLKVPPPRLVPRAMRPGVVAGGRSHAQPRVALLPALADKSCTWCSTLLLLLNG